MESHHPPSATETLPAWQPASGDPEQPAPAWPNIAVCDGRLFALGLPETLTAFTFANSLLRGRQLVRARTVRPVSACPATSAFDRRWLAGIEREWPDHQLVYADGELMLAAKPAG
jgi:hypothetical protein